MSKENRMRRQWFFLFCMEVVTCATLHYVVFYFDAKHIGLSN